LATELTGQLTRVDWLMPLPAGFYEQETLTVARGLLGARLVRVLDGVRISGLITETEAYIGETDLACHARAGLTARTGVMYGPPGRAYVYFTYGMHWMLNAVCGPAGFPAAVLIRAMQIDSGMAQVAARRRGIAPAHWTDGPAKLARALAIDSVQNNIDLTDTSDGLWIEAGRQISAESVTIGPRVGLYTVPEPWKSIPWRFLVTGLSNLEE
jgi:DNA-3-methyladenine glycosylase